MPGKAAVHRQVEMPPADRIGHGRPSASSRSATPVKNVIAVLLPLVPQGVVDGERAVALVAGDALEAQPGQPGHRPGQRHGGVRGVHAAAVHAGVHLDHDPEHGPALTAAADSAAALSASSAATRIRRPAASSASRRILAGCDTVLTTKMSSSPAAASTAASHTVAVDSPPAPASTWRLASSGLLCVL